MRFGIVVSLLCVLLFPFVSPCWADSSKARARKLLLDGNRLSERGLFLDALNKYKKARLIYPSSKIDLNIGSTLDALGRRPEAATYLARFLLQKGDASDKVVQQVRTFLEGIKKKVGSVEVTCPEEGATVKVDGRVIGTTPLAVPIFLEPGEHRLIVTKGAAGAFEKAVRLAAGQHDKLDAPLISGSAPQAQPAPAPAPMLPPAPPPSVHPADQHQGDPIDTARSRRIRTIVAYTTLGLGVALAGSAAVLYGVGLSKGGEAHEAYGAASVQSEIDRHYEDVEVAQRMVVAGHVLAGAAVAVLGVSIYAFVTRPNVLEARELAGPGVSIQPDGGITITLTGRF